MTVRFEFEMCDVDYENMMSLISDGISKNHVKIMSVMANETIEAHDEEKKNIMIAAYRQDIEYINELMSIMNAGCKRIGDDNKV